MNTQYAQATTTDLQAINALVEMGHKLSPEGKIETDYDWEVVGYLWQYWKVNQPTHYDYFMQEMDYFREAYGLGGNTNGSAEEGGGASIQHTGTMPETFYRILKSFFPKIELNKKFMKGLMEVAPEFRMHETKSY